MTNYYDIIRKNIRKFRLEKDLTQKELAKISGLSKDFIREIESPTKNKTFSILTLGKIADSLEIDIKEFFI